MSARPRRPVWEIVKLPLILLAFIGLSEAADPLPWRITLPAISPRLHEPMARLKTIELSDEGTWRSRSPRSVKGS
jgi:hypothetical protein